MRDDLKLAVPPADDPLDEIAHPLLNKTTEQFADEHAKHERIRAIDDQILFKVKIQRWRGAVWTEEDLPWLVAGGVRENGSPDDFYASLEEDGKAARARYNTDHAKPLTSATYTGHLLPNQDDHERYQMEAGARLLRHLAQTIRGLIRSSLGDGREHSADYATFVIGIQVRADDGHETYVAVRITGSVPDNIAYLTLDLVPGCERDGWYPEPQLPGRPLYGAEQAWSNLMDPKAAAKLLEEGE
ncbi:hypothetical protein AB0B89_34540 [Sphaerisporangium sp. NPDC049002]|uniref:hypothetical protein n=1 Tax=unclassified Sphaerisporangium TaxID=2630420 RepID=UPI0033EAD514